MLIFTQNSLANYICISRNCKSQSNLLISMFKIDEQNTEKLIIKKRRPEGRELQKECFD